MRTCKVCEKPAKARGFCDSHWYRWKKHGDPRAGNLAKGAKLRWIESILSTEEMQCITWPFSRNKTGYGSVTYNGRVQLASRVVCEMTHGPASSSDFQAAHSCGGGMAGCVNPRHIRWLSRSENNLEKEAHGTLLRGQQIRQSKLDEESVIAIRRQLAEGRRQADLARQYGVSPGSILLIKNRKNWAWLPEASRKRITIDG